MENETSKSRRGGMFSGIVLGLALGFIIGFIVGINTSPMKVVWMVIGLVCLLIVGITLYRLLRPGKKKE